MTFRILLTSAGRRTKLVNLLSAEARNLEIDLEIHVVDLDPNTVETLSNVFTHKASDALWTEPEEFVSLSNEIQPDVIWPTRNGELLYFATIAESDAFVFDRLLLSSKDFLENSLDKLKLASSQYFDPAIFVPTFTNPKTNSDNKWLVKERFGAGSKGFRAIVSSDELPQLTLEGSSFVYQPFRIGKEFSADIWFSKQQEIHALSLRTRDEVIDGEARKSTFFDSSHIRSMLGKVFENRGGFGPVNIQGFQFVDGTFEIFDVNPRIGGAYYMSMFNGFHILKWLYQTFYELSPVSNPGNLHIGRSVCASGDRYEICSDS